MGVFWENVAFHRVSSPRSFPWRQVLLYSKTCLQGTPLYPRESVPTWQVSLHHRFFNMGKIGHRSEKVSPDHRVSPRRSVPWRQVLLYIHHWHSWGYFTNPYTGWTEKDGSPSPMPFWEKLLCVCRCFSHQIHFPIINREYLHALLFLKRRKMAPQFYVIVSPVRSTYGGYYGLVVVMPPRPQTLHRSHDNLKNPYRIASIFYM